MTEEGVTIIPTNDPVSNTLNITLCIRIMLQWIYCMRIRLTCAQWLDVLFTNIQPGSMGHDRILKAQVEVNFNDKGHCCYF